MSIEGVCVDEKATKKRSKNDELPTESQGFSKVEDPVERLVRVRSETPDLTSDVRDLMQIHQGEHDGVEHREHLGHRREADAAVILPQSYIAAPVEPIFYGPMRTNQLRQTVRGAGLARKA